MLTIAITGFFALALTGSLLIIIMMIHSYQNKIKAVISAELGEKTMKGSISLPQYRTRINKPYATRRCSRYQPAPLRAAA